MLFIFSERFRLCCCAFKNIWVPYFPCICSTCIFVLNYFQYTWICECVCVSSPRMLLYLLRPTSRMKSLSLHVPKYCFSFLHSMLSHPTSRISSRSMWAEGFMWSVCRSTDEDTESLEIYLGADPSRSTWRTLLWVRLPSVSIVTLATKFAVTESRPLVFFGIAAGDIVQDTEMHSNVCETCKFCEKLLNFSHFFCLIVCSSPPTPSL